LRNQQATDEINIMQVTNNPIFRLLSNFVFLPKHGQSPMSLEKTRLFIKIEAMDN
jgi:hypothetical protein